MSPVPSLKRDSGGELLTRMRTQYSALPGLKLTVAQAQRLWHLERSRCEAALSALVDEGFLLRRSDATYVCACLMRLQPGARAHRQAS